MGSSPMGALPVGGASQRIDPECLKARAGYPPDSHLSGSSLAPGPDLLAGIAAVLKHMTTCNETVVQVCFSHLTCESAMALTLPSAAEPLLR